MQLKYSILLVLTFFLTQTYANKGLKTSRLKPRIVVLTDIAPNNIEPDDMESMIRLLVHADLFEIEALIATTGWSNTGGNGRIDLIHNALDAYEKDLPNLQKRSGQKMFLKDESKQQLSYWPSPKYLRSITLLGSAKMGMKFIGEGNDSEGSKRLIEMADENDDRPIWVTVWGGGNTLAQAIWRVQKERSPEAFKRFLHQFRVYTITDQDRPWSSGDTISYAISSHQWMRQFEKELLFFWDECAWKHQNDTGVKNWEQYALNIQNHGSLGALYPKYKWGVEGDTPSFLHCMPSGLSNPDNPNQVSWSGYFEWGGSRDTQTNAYTNYSGKPYEITTKYFAYFYPAIFNNFAARMDWANEGKGNRNPVVVVNKSKGLNAIEIHGVAGATVKLDASKSFDPDGNTLHYKWWFLPEASTFTKDILISNSDSKVATVQIPSDSSGDKFHIICEVTDDGTPNLTSYRRVILFTKVKTDRAS